MNGSRSCTAAVSSRGSLRTSPARPASAPASRAAAVRACEQTSATCPAPGVRATSTSSSPTEITDTRGRGCTSTLSRPAAASIADLGRAEHGVAADGDVAGLHVLADPAHERRRRHAARHRQLGGAGVGVADGHDRVGERGQRRPGDHAHGLPRLQPQRMARPGRDLADDGQHHRRLLARPGEVDAAHRVAVDRRLVEPGQRAGGDHLLRAAQAVRLRDRHPHRCGTDRAGQDPGELLVDRPHRRHAPRRVARAVACRVTSPAEPDAPCSIVTPRRSRSVGAEPIGGSSVKA